MGFILFLFMFGPVRAATLKTMLSFSDHAIES